MRVLGCRELHETTVLLLVHAAWIPAHRDLALLSASTGHGATNLGEGVSEDVHTARVPQVSVLCQHKRVEKK